MNPAGISCEEAALIVAPTADDLMILQANGSWEVDARLRFEEVRRISGVRRLSSLRVVAWVTILLFICGALGCKTSSPSQIVSPRIIGRVVEAQSHQPIKDAKVRRVTADQDRRSPYVQRGGQMMEQSPAVRTAADGTFMLDCVRDLAMFRKLGWYDVKISFEHPGYERFVATYTATNAVITPEGIPVVNTGDVAMAPVSK